MRTIRALTVMLLVATAGAALAADDHNHGAAAAPGGQASPPPAGQSMPTLPASGGGSQMPMGMGMGMMPMQSGSQAMPASPNSGSMGMGMAPMRGGPAGQGSAAPSMAMPSAAGAGGMGCMMPMMQSMGGSRAGMGMMGGMPMGGAQASTPKTDFLEGRLAFLRTELNLAPAQQPLWDSFASAVRATQNSMPSAAPAAAGSITQRLDAEEHQELARLTATRQLKAAVVPLYTALDDSQKRVFDQLSQHQLGLL